MLDDRIFKALTGFVLALSLAACGGSGGGGGTSGGGGSSASAGWLIAWHFNAGQESINIYHADDGSMPVQTLPGGRIYGPAPGVGLLYGKDPSALGFAEIGVFTSGGAPRIVFASQAGHGYDFPLVVGSSSNFHSAMSLVNGRLIAIDATAAGKSVISFAKDGSDQRTLVSGCTVLNFFSNIPRNSSGGLIFGCNNGGGKQIWATKGLAPAVALPQSELGLNGATPLATDGDFAILVNGATGRITTQHADGSDNPKQMSPENGAVIFDSILAIAGSTALLTTQTTTVYDTWTIPFDPAGAPAHPHLNGQGPALPGFITPVTADHQYFMVTFLQDVPGQARTFLWPVQASNMNVINLTPSTNPAGNQSVFGAGFFADGKALIGRVGVGWQVMATDGTGTVGPVLDPSINDTLHGTVGNFAIFQDAVSPYALRAAREDGTLSTVLTAKGEPGVAPLLLASGRILFVDDNHLPWLATPDLSTKVQLDTVACSESHFTGGDGKREFYAVIHYLTGVRNTIVFHTDTGQVEKIPGGPTTSD